MITASEETIVIDMVLHPDHSGSFHFTGERSPLLTPDGIMRLVGTTLNCTFLGNVRSEQGELLDLNTAQNLISEALGKMRLDFSNRFGCEFNQYGLDRTAREFARSNIHARDEYLFALDKLGIDRAHAGNIQLPWWNEQIGLESSFSVSGSEARAEIFTTHSYHNQLARQGLSAVQCISIIGIIRTAPDENYPQGAVLLGLRGGGHYPNSFHLIPAGAVRISGELVENPAVVANPFAWSGLQDELGALSRSLSQPQFIGRIIDPLNKGPAYVYSVETALQAKDILSMWNQGSHAEKGQHQDIHFLAERQDAVREFLQRFYFGEAPPSKSLTPERFALPPCAYALALAFNLDAGELIALEKRAIPVSLLRD